MDLHESPVTACLYFADCPPDLIPAFYSVGCRLKKSGYSDKEWPIKGGEWGSAACSYSEIIITGYGSYMIIPVSHLKVVIIVSGQAIVMPCNHDDGCLSYAMMSVD